MKLAINLLPENFRAEQLKNTRFYKIQLAGIAIVLLMFFLSSTVMALRILQSQSITLISNRVSASEQRVADLRHTENTLSLLKNRLTTIGEYLGSSSTQVQAYQLINNLFPPSVSVISASVSHTSEILVSVAVPDAEVLESLIVNLTSQDSNEDKISQVSLESIGRSRDGVYRISLKIKPKL